MALNITTLSERWGDIIGGVNEANTFAGTTIATRANNIYDEYGSLAAQREVVDDLYSQAINVRSDIGDWTNYLWTLLGTTLETMCRDDTARPRSNSVEDLFYKLNTDMTASSDTFWRPTVTGTISIPATNIGDGYLITSVIEPVDGVATYYAYAEIIRLVCTEDSYSSETSAGEEVFTVNGETSVDLKAYDWPKGSGAGGTITPTSITSDEIITDGEFEDWTLVSGSNYNPTSWGLLTGTVAGTTINRNVSVVYSGTYSCKFTGDGATQIGIYQNLDQDVVKGNTNYAISFWYRNEDAASTGTLTVSLADGSGSVITNNAGTNQSDASLVIDSVAADTWTQYRIAFQTPRNLPTTLRLQLKWTTALSAHDVYIDHLIMSEMDQFYPGGPYMALHAGATAFAKNDKFLNTVANDKTGTNFVRALDRGFRLAENGIRLQTAASFTILDSLIA